MEAAKSNNIDREIERRRQEQDKKVKMLLLGAGESGKSTIFKQMRILYGTTPSDDDLRYYGTIVRSNVVVAMRKLLSHLRHLGLEEELDKETAESNGSSGMSLREAYDTLMEYLVDKTQAAAMEALAKNFNSDGPQDQRKDWVGTSQRAGKVACNDSILFLKFVDQIRIIWNVRESQIKEMLVYSTCILLILL